MTGRLTCGCSAKVDQAHDVYPEGTDADRAYCPKHGDVYHVNERTRP